MKKILILLITVLMVVCTRPILPVTASSLNVYSCTHNPSPVGAGVIVTVTCSFSESQMLDIATWVNWRVNGGTFQDLLMTESGSTFTKTIGSFSAGDFVEYYVDAWGEDTNYALVSDRDPLSGYRSFTVQPSSSITWSSPSQGEVVNFEGENNPFTFTFDWSYTDLDDADLILGSNTFDILNAGTKTTSVPIDYAPNLDGTVTAQLIGYKGGNQVVTASRSFNFAWVRFVDQYLEESGNEVVGDKLYLIIHDPSGDESTSNFAQTQTITMNAGIEVTGGVSITTKAGGSLFGVGGEASAGVSLEATVGAEFSYSMSVGTALSSSQVNDDPDFMGPGRGDYYWGEAWILYWQIMSTKTTYWNGDTEYTDPELLYGIHRDLEVFIGDQEAPTGWRNSNPVWNDFAGVNWIDSKTVTGGAPFSESTKYQTTSTLSASITVTISAETKAKFFFGSSKVELSLSTSLSSSISSENEEILGYTIHDDDPTDLISQDVGIDNRFGTYIFRTHPFSTTSNPLEIGTTDYQNPIIEFPTVSYDTDGITPSPSQDDSPLVTSLITDEGGISKAVVCYSTDGGKTYGRVNMTEQAGNPGTWQANLPKQSHGTIVQWYVEAWDNSNNAAVRKDVNDNDYVYTVLNRSPTVTIVSPNGGETLSNDVTISWFGMDLDNDILSYSLGYNIDNQGWTLIASGISEQSYLWDISGFLDSDNVVVKVIVSDGFGGSVEDVSDFVFSIDNADTPDVAVNSPLSGLIYSNLLTINWDLIDVDDLATTFDLYYSNNSGVDWNLIAENIIKSKRNFDWDTSVIVFSSSSRIKIDVHFEVDSKSQITSDISDIFTIDNRPDLEVALVYPNGGESVKDSTAISWTITTHPEVVYQSSLEYSLNGVTWYKIANNIEESSYDWITHPLDYGTNYRVRVYVSGTYLGYSLNIAMDVSEGSFTINPDHETPVISAIEDITFENTTVGNILSWKITDDNPFNYSIIQDSTYLIKDQSWSNGDEITIGIDGLNVGTHEFVLLVTDIWGQQSSDNVIVKVTYTPPAPPIFEVSITNPNGGEVVVNNNLQLSWELDNSYALPVSFDLFYSSDDGITWRLIVKDLTTSTYQWDISELENGPDFYVKVVATSSFNDEILISEDRSDNAFSIVHNIEIDTESLTIQGAPGYTLLLVIFSSLFLVLSKRKKK